MFRNVASVLPSAQLLRNVASASRRPAVYSPARNILTSRGIHVSRTVGAANKDGSDDDHDRDLTRNSDPLGKVNGRENPSKPSEEPSAPVQNRRPSPMATSSTTNRVIPPPGVSSAAASISRGGSSLDGNGSAGDGSDDVPIAKSERLLPIQLPYRPVFPGMASHFVSTDPKLIAALRKLRATNAWNNGIVAFMSKRDIKTAQLVQNVDDVYDVGCACLLDQVVFAHGGSASSNTNRDAPLGSTNQPQQFPSSAGAGSGKGNSTTPTPSGRSSTTVHGVIYPRFRVKVGELVESIKGGGVSGSVNGATEPPNPLDSVVVQWMRDITALPNEPYAVQDEEVQTWSSKIIEGLRDMSALSSSVRIEVEKFSQLVPLSSPGGSFKQPDFLADFAASLIPRIDGLQEILEMTNVKQRLKVVADLVSKEVAYMRVQEGIYKYGHDQSQQRNRELILHEYLRYIKKELGMDGDDKSKLADKFQERADGLDMPKDVRRVFDEEMNKFRSLEPNAGEYNTVRTYLDWLSQLPWGKFSQDKFAIRDARSVLNKSHFGLEDVKDRILEFLAVGKLSGSVDGKIICLAGPPGVGKTSIAKSIADALDRKFDRFSVGGLYDVSEIKGHRRTYVASLPGRIVQALKKVETLNPVILIDEVDKLGRLGSHGDPAAALLEVLDPEQNKAFQDTYLEVPIDLSRVLFVCTANNLDTIPAPLMDRMEIIHVPGYLPAEKVAIAANYLAPKARKESGLGHADVTISESALERLVTKYTRESGVRGLSKSIEKIYRKLAFQFVQESEETKQAKKDEEKQEVKKVSNTVGETPVEPIKAADPDAGADAAEPELLLSDEVEKFKLSVDSGDLAKYVGPPSFNSDRLYDIPPPGVSIGLGWTPTGGVPLFIESVIQEALSKKASPKLMRTGQLGEVMNESASIAYSFARMYMTKRFPRNRFLDHAVIHTHFPEGAIKKDGPSAGIAMATSLVSLAMDIPASPDVAMTGELTLTGKVLQIGGLREKAVAAKTMGSKVLVFPEDNRAEWEDLPSGVKEGMEARPVRDFQQVFDVVFGSNLDAAKVNAAWPELQAATDDAQKTVTATP